MPRTEAGVDLVDRRVHGAGADGHSSSPCTLVAGDISGPEEPPLAPAATAPPPPPAPPKKMPMLAAATAAAAAEEVLRNGRGRCDNETASSSSMPSVEDMQSKLSIMSLLHGRGGRVVVRLRVTSVGN
jgi:hypothetical protein